MSQHDEEEPDFFDHGGIVPARVVAAMEFLDRLTHKTRTGAAINEDTIEKIDGQRLTTAESNAQATACNMLNDYFRGKMRPNYWERARPGIVVVPDESSPQFAREKEALRKEVAKLRRQIRLMSNKGGKK